MNEITAKVVAVTTTDEDIIKNTGIDDYMIDSGHSANICYTQKSYDEILNENVENTLKRAEANKTNLHHSVFGHDHLSIYFEGIPKLIAMMINNEKEYDTSEKSGRYTTMFGTEKENELYNKWLDIFEKEIKSVYPNEKYLTDKMINKKAKENARYLLSVFMRTKMKYTTSYEQLNYIYGFVEKSLEEETTNPLKIAAKPYLEEFRDALLATNFITDNLRDYRKRGFSLIVDGNDYKPQFGRSYSVNYDSSIPALADIQRHRSLDYNFSLKDKKEFYVPVIIRDKKDLVEEWVNDLSSVSEFPQGMLVNVNETGKYENFILKMYQRICTAPQLEVMHITKDTLVRYINALEKSNDPRDKKIYEELLQYNNGARCTFDGFDCPEKCGFKEGIELVRKI